MAFEKMIYPFMVIIIIMNSMFIGLSYMPTSPDATTTLGDVWGNKLITDMNGSLNVFGNSFELGSNISSDTNLEATIDPTDKIDAFTTLLFGAMNIIGTGIGGAFALLAFMAQALFGYFLWIDFLLNPAWHPLVAALNLGLKAVFFIIELVGIIEFAKGFFIFRNLF